MSRALRSFQNDVYYPKLAGAAAPVATVTRFPSWRSRSPELELEHLSVELDASAGLLFARMKHRARACYTPALMQDMRRLQHHLVELYAGRPTEEIPFRYLVWASEAPKAWSLGGDLATFTGMIRAKDEAGLRAYAHLAIDILHDNLTSLGLPILTVALIQGDAIGGGFEAMLTDDLVIAEASAKFGLPEILFNLFPGMGGYSFLKRKLGAALARQILEDGLSRSAAEVKALGLVDLVCAEGQAEATLRGYVADNARRFKTLLTLKQVRERADPPCKAELVDIVDLWVDLALELGEDELRRMDCLARVQEKKRALAGQAVREEVSLSKMAVGAKW
ncbi:crotonase/enoyl-CoA hydratase family protein [Geminicoccus roseus]|uniref:crotonase/enoyl-CoA hydratase family protein n=1 Tax=Geminicoccus roseus TaxID=404900 RepID=UPI000685E35B|nr:crotonase/enoyl-CoA hydratase family protein [Geminicoccus roseus]